VWDGSWQVVCREGVAVMEQHPLIKELADLLAKYDASIDFTMADCSDTYGIYDEAVEITVGRNTVLRVEGWSIDKSDIVVL
jgi:hypothetical protein